VPGKLYEYIASAKPILAVTPRGSEVDRVFQETECGVSAEPHDIAGIATMLERAYMAWRNGEPLARPRRDLILRYDRQRLAEEYGKVMQTMRRAGTQSDECIVYS